MECGDFFAAARVPLSIPAPQEFGLWTITRRQIPPTLERIVGGPTQTALCRITEETCLDGDIVMEDSVRELSRHLPAWFAARGRVLVTGLGLGCVVRGLLANPVVEHIDVVEIDSEIIRRIGVPCFGGDPRVTIHEGDALCFRFPRGVRWDFAWHDLHNLDGTMHLDLMHLKLMARFEKRVAAQGAWGLRRWLRRIWATAPLGRPLVGSERKLVRRMA